MIRFQIDKTIEASENENEKLVFFSFYKPNEETCGWFIISIYEKTTGGKKLIYKNKLPADKFDNHHDYIPTSNIEKIMNTCLDDFCNKDRKSRSLCKKKKYIEASSYAHLINFRKIDNDKENMEIFIVPPRSGNFDLIPSIKISNQDSAPEALSKTFGCNVENINTVAVLRNIDKGHTNYLCVLNEEELQNKNGSWKNMSEFNPNKLGEILLDTFCSSGDENCCGEKVILTNISAYEE